MKNPNQRVFTAKSIGSVALEILSKDQDARVSGITSKGIFIKTSGKWLIFLSFEQFRGPLTLTLDEIDPILRLLSGGNSVRIASQSITFPDIDCMITIEGSEVWQPPPPSASQLGVPERHEKVVYFAKEIMSKKKGVGLGNLNWADIQQLQYYLRNREAVSLARLLSTILGSGPGLTPSADDFIIGLLLTLNRWQNLLWTADRLRELNLQVVEAAYEKTTTLSANLIECATLGLADGRLINALDWLMTGVAREPEIADHLLGWGNSSGVDAFVGMAVTLYTD